MLPQKEMPTVVGVKQTRRALKSGLARKVLLARDADPILTGSLETLCRDARVDVEWSDSMKELGQFCGIAVGAAAAAILF